MIKTCALFDAYTHSALGQGESPVAAFRGDTKTLQFVNSETLANAFLHCESRKMDKSGCNSSMSKQYEVGRL